ncbi:MAG: RagB/SusD family nutrient uptake outer membrane protein [Prevotellaceae bacterium]|nr:RagB/SusD family nutrient uptake outer membrane protein [Prevotellaceae bacterium]MDY3365849.1 RagB/SusD family nutrient uptake outer membrane protein [Prevotella sp.]
MDKKILGILLTSLTLVSCDDFLTREPLDTITDKAEFWSNESNIRTSVLDLYTTYFPGYRSGWNRADWYSETNIADWTDDNAQTTATFFTKVAPSAASSSSWNFDDLRTINLQIRRISNAALPDEVKNHWLGVTRFLRAMEYAKLVSRFGDVPYFTEDIASTDYLTLYQPRENRTAVMDKVLEDLNFAAANVRKVDGAKGLTINNDVTLAFASRIMLFEGTWQKYKAKNTTAATKYLKAAKDFADKIIQGNAYRLCPNYKDLTTSIDLAGNPEIILYRAYVDGVVTHSLMTFQNTETEINSPSKSLVDTYLSKNGLPIHQTGNSMFKGDQWFYDEMKDRDPRLYATVDTTGLFLVGVAGVPAISGYFGNRFVNESLKNTAGGRSTTCITDAPVMKLNEVLMNYIEAAAELASMGAYTLTQADFDKTINTLRKRPSTNMPQLTLSGDNLLVNGVTINDPKRDADVSSILWEVRRERRTELVYEGIRFNDLRRWGKLHYADMKANPQLNMGAWLDKARYVEWYNKHFQPAITIESLNSIKIDRAGNAGYIIPITDEALMRVHQEKDYLYPLPEDQITLYESRGYKLPQNPGW